MRIWPLASSSRSFCWSDGGSGRVTSGPLGAASRSSAAAAAAAEAAIKGASVPLIWMGGSGGSGTATSSMNTGCFGRSGRQSAW